ncbi:MAG: hypothetical protein OXE03_10120 [Gammaproteobacteria bacterium]|nr:hypothetical protein [Gammaproteobacteria bacterium]MCY4283255.1 hypothetical protein [Gammaproteobacteria bacterium]
MAAALVIGTFVFGAGAHAAPLLLSCHGGPETRIMIITNLCDALAQELDRRKPGSVIRRSEAQDDWPGKAWEVTLQVSRTEDYHWEANLSWKKTRRGSDGQQTTGPELEMFGMDAPLGEAACLHFVRSLLTASKPAFLAPPKDATMSF